MTEENTMFYYDSNYDEELCNKEEVVKVESTAIPPFYISVFVLSCICYILILVFLALFKSLKSLTNILTLNLTLSNLLFIFGLLFSALYIWDRTFGEVVCKAMKFLFFVGFYSSVLFLTLMTVQCYMAVVHPLSDWERCRCFFISPFIIWILSGTVALLVSLHSKVMTVSDSQYCVYDSFEWIFVIVYFLNAIFFIAFLIMFFCYGRMFWTIKKSQTNKRHKTVRLTFFIALVFFISWAPYNIVMFLRSLTIHQFRIECEESNRLDYALIYALRMTAFSHCCISPAILVFVHARFRNPFEQFQGDFV